MKHLKIIPLLLACMLLCGCPMDYFSYEPDLAVRFVNESNDTIYTSSFMWSDDTTEICAADYFENDWLQQTTAPGDSFEIRIYSLSMKVDNRRLQFIVFNRSTFENHPKEELIKENIYDYRYILYYKDLEERKFRIVYPDVKR